MASFRLPDDPIKDDEGDKGTPIILTALEKDYLGFLLYQFGDDVETDKQSQWIERLSGKL